MKIDWQPIEDVDAEGRGYTAYISVNSPHGKKPVVLEQIGNGTWDVLRLVSKETGTCSSPMVNCKTLTSAKRWAARYYFGKS